MEPLERALSLMELLYPVVLVLSLLTAAGTAVLFVLMSAKDAAILRIQGTSKLHTTVIFVLQQGLTVLAGLAVSSGPASGRNLRGRPWSVRRCIWPPPWPGQSSAPRP